MKNKKRILLITKFLKGIHPNVGGMETHVDDLIRELKKDKSYEITIITSKHPHNKKEEIRNRIKIYYVNQTISRNPLSRYLFFKSTANKLKKLNYKEKFDLIHIQSDFGVGYFHFIKKELPVISTIHGTSINEFKGSIKAKPYLLPIWLFILPLYYFSERNMLKNSDKIICVSELVKDSLLFQHKFIQPSKVNVILNGINLNQFKKIKNKKTKKLRLKFANKDDFLMLTAGNIIKQKGYHLIIKALPQVLKEKPNIKLIIVGEGNYLKKLKNMVEKNNLEKNVFLVGRVQRKDLIKYYNISDCFIFPTLRGEGLPYVLIEAMACGNVVITTHNGSGGLINNKNGMVINPNKGELVKAIIKLTSNKKLYNKLLKQAKKDVREKCNLKKMVNKTKKIYEKFFKSEQRMKNKKPKKHSS